MFREHNMAGEKLKLDPLNSFQSLTCPSSTRADTCKPIWKSPSDEEMDREPEVCRTLGLSSSRRTSDLQKNSTFNGNLS